MKKIILSILVLAFLICSLGIANADTYVRGYTKSNGTYVAPHYRSDPDGYIGNNWGTYPNVNPYTGKIGTKRYW